MNIDAMVCAMPFEVYERLLQAVETGKWPDGTHLTPAQRDSSLQAVMMYQAKVLKPDQHMQVGGNGQIIHKSKRDLKQQFQPSIARFKTDDI